MRQELQVNETEPSDDTLMERLAMGDTSALELLYLRHRGVVNAVLHHAAGSLHHSDAEDVCHEVFLTLRDIASRYRPGQTLRGWLCGIAVRKARRLRRSRWLHERLLSRAVVQKAPETPMAAVEHRLDVEKVLRALPSGMREVVVLSCLEQLSAEEISAALGISVNTVWTRLHRARERVRQSLLGAPR